MFASFESLFNLRSFWTTFFSQSLISFYVIQIFVHFWMFEFECPICIFDIYNRDYNSDTLFFKEKTAKRCFFCLQVHEICVSVCTCMTVLASLRRLYFVKLLISNQCSFQISGNSKKYIHQKLQNLFILQMTHTQQNRFWGWKVWF